MNENEERFTAIHEAGHVIAAKIFEELLWKQWESVTIEKTEDAMGHVRLLERTDGIDPIFFKFAADDETNEEDAGICQREIEAILCWLLAGEAATYLENGKRDEEGSGRSTWDGDFASCMEFMESIFDVSGDPEAAGNKAAWHYIEALFWRTVVMLNAHERKEEIHLLADALVERRTLTRAETEQLLSL